MPLVERSTYKKPWDEPFREWDLESCVYCRSSMALDDTQCSKCGHQRSREDIRMADQVSQYRCSVQGQQQYQAIHNHEQAQLELGRWISIGGAFLGTWIISWFLGTIIWGAGGTFAWMASLSVAILIWAHTDPNR